MRMTLEMGLRCVALAAAIGGFFVAGASCGNGFANDWCDRRCECEGCSDRGKELCVTNLTADIERADAYGCSAERDDFDSCRKREGDCDRTDWRLPGNACSTESTTLNKCIDDASAIIGQPTGNTQCNCACTCTTCGPQPANPACPSGVGCESCASVCLATCATTAGCGVYVSSTGTCQ